MDITTALPASRSTHGRLLALMACVAALALAVHGPIVQWLGYHQFADARAWGGLPNAVNVLSNLPFALIGAWGWWRLGRRPGMHAWRCFAAAVMLTALGSSLYHWHTDNTSLVADRIPIAWACASLLCAFLGERFDERWSIARTLLGALAASSVAVACWAAFGDLRAYVFVQFLPMLLIPTALMLKVKPRTPHAVPASAWWSALGLYGAAKLMELADHAMLEALGSVSGHSLKHLLAAAAAAVLLRAAVRAQLR
ncbi:MAG: alkaline phytoceramidase [Cytophagales bacterium]|nr:alkaline phytoceramidase [Rhizobacter sp.]